MKNRNLVIDSDLNKVSDILADVPGGLNIRNYFERERFEKYQTKWKVCRKVVGQKRRHRRLPLLHMELVTNINININCRVKCRKAEFVVVRDKKSSSSPQ